MSTIPVAETLDARSPFRRSDQTALGTQATLRALRKLASAERIVIYCGAGVTIDRTGLGWAQMLRAAYAPIAGTSDGEYPSSADIELMSNREDATQLATILARYGVDERQDRSLVLPRVAGNIAQRLYTANGWQAGRLTRKIATLAWTYKAMGRTVSIVTTNYDEHIEDALKESFAAMESEGAALGSLEDALQTYVVKDSRTEPTAGAVNLYYLHGKIPQSGQHEGHLVLGEGDYLDTRDNVLRELRQLLDDDASLLVVGSSMSDPPLVEALYRTGGEFLRDAFDSPRIVVTSMQSLGYADLEPSRATRLSIHACSRFRALGLDHVRLDFNFQIAQFLDELLAGLSTGNVDGGGVFEKGAPESYGQRLCLWWDAWHASDLCQDTHQLWAMLHEARTYVEGLIKARSSELANLRSADEAFRIELWVRSDPRTRRSLALWATSDGPLTGIQLRREEEICLGSASSTVRALVEGRPQHSDLHADFIRGERVSVKQTRWHSFLSIPVYVRCPGSSVTARIPVGVITLASSLPIEKSSLPFGEVEHMNTLKTELLQLGRDCFKVA